MLTVLVSNRVCINEVPPYLKGAVTWFVHSNTYVLRIL